ncbi:MAG: hypothetical protein ACU0DX_16485, partial [Roseovarius sp.]
PNPLLLAFLARHRSPQDVHYRWWTSSRHSITPSERGHRTDTSHQIILGMILGPMAEQSVRRALLISRGDPAELFTRPLSAVLALATPGMIIWPRLKLLRSKRSEGQSPGT